jgi:hypothetical protein
LSIHKGDNCPLLSKSDPVISAEQKPSDFCPIDLTTRTDYTIGTEDINPMAISISSTYGNKSGAYVFK